MTTPNKIVDISKAPPSPLPASLRDASAYIATAVTALGGRQAAVAPAFDVDLLQTACTNLGIVSNPGRSTGCSPVLRALLQQAGCEYQVSREIFDDEDSANHQGGNALDVVSDNLPAIARFIRTVYPLFHQVIYYNVNHSAESLWVQDGLLSGDGTLFPVSVRYLSDSIHISSSLSRLRGQFDTGLVRSALSDPQWTLPQFSNRNVYAARLPVPSSLAEGIGVNFW